MMREMQMELFAQQNPNTFKMLAFSTTCRYYELEAIKRAKPRHVLLSYAHWQNKDIQTDFINRVGYRPETILIDSGAYTFFNAGQQTGIEELLRQQPAETSTNFHRYINWLNKNKNHYDHAIQMDEIGDGETSLLAYWLM